MKELSIVVPVYNEERNLGILYNEISLVLGKSSIDYEVVFVDDGSRDRSFFVMGKLKEKDSKVKVVKLLNNYGQSSAITAGVENASGDVIVTMDSDLQHDPRDIPRLYKKVKEGWHVVCGWRIKQRNRGFGKVVFSKISNFLINLITNIKLHDSTGGMRAFRKEVAENIETYGEMHRYLPILASWKGYKVTELPINVRARKYGRSKYGVGRIFRGFLDLLTVKFLVSYSSRPLHVFGTVGFFLGVIGFLGGLYLVLRKLLFGIGILANTPLLMLSILLIILGVLFFGFGFLGDMIYLNSVSNGKKSYIVEKFVK